LIDPSYEIKSDYRQAIEALSQMHKRFATGIYALWYPVIERSRNQQLEKAIQSSGIKNVQLFELSLTDDASGHGMTASGVIVINPPWTLADKMQQTLPWLANALTDTSGAHYRIERLVQE
jgi:23S rRNA (adenine2030-N6)-methyltransferase